MKQVLALLCAVAAASAIAAAAFAVVSALPHPTHGDLFAVRVLDALRHRRGSGSLISIRGRNLRARCVRLRNGREHVTLSDGTELVLRGSHVFVLREPSTPLATAHFHEGPIAAAEADAAGSYKLYSDEVVAQLERAARITPHRAVIHRQRAIVITLREARPRVELFVAAQSLQPIAARFRTRGLTVESRIMSSARAGRGC